MIKLLDLLANSVFVVPNVLAYRRELVQSSFRLDRFRHLLSVEFEVLVSEEHL